MVVIIFFLIIFAIMNRPCFNIVECTEYHNIFSSYCPEFEKDTAKVISKRELRKTIEHYFCELEEQSLKDPKFINKCIIDKTIFVYYDKENGVFRVSFGVYVIDKKSGYGYYYGRGVVCINASNGEIISVYSPTLQNDGTPLEIRLP